nr:DUF480 domain-containing protein [Mesorhizobium temperatum]
MTDTELPILSPVEARVLGCLIEKKELTPDIYPLTLNAALAAANQKTAREPVMSVELAEVRRALGQLEHKGLVRQVFASRVERYEHVRRTALFADLGADCAAWAAVAARSADRI